MISTMTLPLGAAARWLSAFARILRKASSDGQAATTSIAKGRRCRW